MAEHDRHPRRPGRRLRLALAGALGGVLAAVAVLAVALAGDDGAHVPARGAAGAVSTAAASERPATTQARRERARRSRSRSERRRRSRSERRRRSRSERRRARSRRARASSRLRASDIRPHPRRATEDKGHLHAAGCLVDGKDTYPPKGRCVYGDRDSDTNVVVFGDSHALQYFPAMRVIARERGWRLVGLTRASCPVADVDYQPTCNAWRANMMRRITRRERPDLVVISFSTGERFRVKVGGRRISRRESQPLLERGFRRTLQRIRATGARIVVIRDMADAPAGLSDCVLRNLSRVERCAFRPHRSTRNAYDRKGARGVRGVKVIDPMPVLCPKRRCPAVVDGNILVYRNYTHLRATFARTLAPWLARRLPKLD